MERVYHYLIDEEGGLWIEGTQLTDPKVLKFFMRTMEPGPGGNFLVNCLGEKNIIRAQDVPYVVQGLDWNEAGIELIFPGGYREVLDPDTLFVGEKNVMYCKVRGGKFTARFQRKPYLELARHIEGKLGQGFFLKYRGQKYAIGGNIQ